MSAGLGARARDPRAFPAEYQRFRPRRGCRLTRQNQSEPRQINELSELAVAERPDFARPSARGTTMTKYLIEVTEQRPDNGGQWICCLLLIAGAIYMMAHK